jgi:hypothetical protein
VRALLVASRLTLLRFGALATGLLAVLAWALAAPFSAWACSPLPTPYIPDGAVGAPQVAAGAAGEAVVLWPRRSGLRAVYELKAAIRRPDGTWSAPESVTPLGEAHYQARVAMDRSGTVIVVWHSDAGVRAAVRTVGGAFGPPQTLSSPGLSVGSLQLALDAEGNATAAWFGSAGNGTAVQVSSRPAGGSWMAPVDVGPGGAPALAVGPGGRVAIAWTVQSGDVSRMYATVRSSLAAPFESAARLSADRVSAKEHAVAVSPAGHVLVAWRGEQPGPYHPRANADGVAQVVERAPGAEWSKPRDLSLPEEPGPPVYPPMCGGGTPILPPAAALDAEGGAMVVWRQRQADNSRLLQFASRPAGGDWSVPQGLGKGEAPRLLVRADGAMVVIWSAGAGLSGATRPAGGTFGAPEAVPGSAHAMDAAGGVTAAWSDGTIRATRRAPDGGWGPTETVSQPDPFVEPPLPDAIASVSVTPARTAQKSCLRRSARRGRAPRLMACRRTPAPRVLVILTRPAAVKLTLQRRGRPAVIASANLSGPAGSHSVRLPRWRAKLAPGVYVITARVLPGCWRTDPPAGPEKTTRLVLVPSVVRGR